MSEYNGNNGADDALKTLDNDGSAPKTRIGDGNQAYSIWTSLWMADNDRSARRTRVQGLIDGNPPYKPADLVSAGRSYACNVNWGDAKSYVDNASGAIYDLITEGKTFSTVAVKRTKQDAVKYSESITANFDWLLRGDARWDYNIQVSQEQTTIYSVGPLVFPDTIDYMPRAVLARHLKVPEWAKSDTSYWELCAVEVEYKSDELWRKIVDEKVATKAGWNVSAVKQAIMNAHPAYWNGQLYQQWEWHQQQLKNGAWFYGQNSKVISVVHLFFQEFSDSQDQPGKISQVTINQDQAAQQKAGAAFLYQKVGKYDSWNQCVHPMYYDRGGGGLHHSVTGLGVKMFPALTFMNRLKCANGDKAFAPKMGFKPSTATNADEFSLEVHGDYMVLNEGFEPIQMPVQSFLEDGMAFHQRTKQELNENISQYRQSSIREDGNPPTATQVKYDASNEARLQKTQANRYYNQEDALLAEMFRRAVIQGKKKVGYNWQRCKEFIDRCIEDGVPEECLEPDHIESVRATRVIGQGSEFTRQQALEFLWVTIGMTLPESGRKNLIEDMIASRAGQNAVKRYMPEGENPQQQDQLAWATSTVADMKVGVAPVVTSSQDPIVFLGVYINAAHQAIQSLDQGAQPEEVVSFLEICGQSIAGQLQKIAQDPSRKQIVQQVEKELKQIGQVVDKLTEHLQQQAQAQQEQAMIQQQQMSDEALKKQKQDFELGLKAQKTQFGMQEKAMKTRQAMSISDAEAANRLRQSHAEHTIDTVHGIQEHEMDMEKEKAKLRNGSKPQS